MQAAQAEISSSLVDPGSAVYTWPYTFEIIEENPLFGQRTKRWRTCGTLNARNKMGGYSGTSFVIAEFEGGKLAATGVGEDERFDVVNMVCERWIKRGMIRSVAPGIPSRLNANPASQASVGIGFVPSPAGAVIVAVAPGSIADRAGLKVGQVIVSVNEISLKGRSQAEALTILGALPPTYVMSIAGSMPVTITRPLIRSLKPQ
ncbi:MAG: hypothetical protein B7Z34_02670 [Novosphingobium sp. 12-62-10]|nr:MAG: hypothetical protein B7Z34_02670 [Novosphingobium sp. 12-62-10]